jgi:cytochrome bd-type quinol oxidase subunit 2
LAIAHYLAGVVFFMIVRHGVLQTAADKSDTTVLFFGVGGMLLVVTAAVFMNYTYDWRFLPTLLAFAFPMLTFAAAMLLLVDRDWNLRRNEITQTMDDLPAEAVH